MTASRVASSLCFALLATAASAFAAPDGVSDTIAERTRACTACHGKEGRATREGFFPRIAGKPAGYLYNQLANFRDGRRTNAAMTYLVQHLTDDYLREIAAYFAALDLPYAPPPPHAGSAEALRLGETLVLHGDEARQIPACVRCHGPTMTGAAPAMPGLLGLPRDYIISQFGSWRSGQRRAAAPDCMAQITSKLSNEDISAVAGWLASRPIPPSAKPVERLPQPVPMLCGSGLEGNAR
jgi:cytochrome c553